MKNHYTILIVGGGTGGIMTAAQLKRQESSLDIGLIEPSEFHYYQPAWTLVAAGTYKMEKTKRNEKDYIPKGVDWIKDYVTEVKPEDNKIVLKSGTSVTYDYLVLSPGLVMNMDGIEGLKESMDSDLVCSNYIDPEKTWKILQNFKGGNALFLQPAGAIKCGGAPQKIMYLAEDYLRKNSLREKSNVFFTTPGSVIFGVTDFKKTLEKIIEDRNILFQPHFVPVKIDAKAQKVYYTINDDTVKAEKLVNDSKGVKLEEDGTVSVKYDMLHLAPPQQAPDFIRNSKLAHADGPNKGWMQVDIHSMQHTTFKNVFGLGDVAALPTAKTGAAIRKQTPVLVENLISMMQKGKITDASYSGYSSCPLVTRYGRMVLAEFKYDNVRDSDPMISKFVDTSKEQWTMWILKKYGLPYLYWNKMLKGKM